MSRKQSRKERTRIIFFIGILPFLAGVLIPFGLWIISLVVLGVYGYSLDKEFGGLE